MIAGGAEEWLSPDLPTETARGPENSPPWHGRQLDHPSGARQRRHHVVGRVAEEDGMAGGCGHGGAAEVGIETSSQWKIAPTGGECIVPGGAGGGGLAVFAGGLKKFRTECVAFTK